VDPLQGRQAQVVPERLAWLSSPHIFNMEWVKQILPTIGTLLGGPSAGLRHLVTRQAKAATALKALLLL
jgi:hypothetical protein